MCYKAFQLAAAPLLVRHGAALPPLRAVRPLFGSRVRRRRVPFDVWQMIMCRRNVSSTPFGVPSLIWRNVGAIERGVTRREVGSFRCISHPTTGRVGWVLDGRVVERARRRMSSSKQPVATRQLHWAVVGRQLAV